jgi:hypothetical protein
MVQQDLFASVPPPAPTAPSEPAPAVQAAAHVEQVVRKKRSEAGRAPVPFATGPVSDATGGPLSAAEASRVVTGKTIRCSGYQWQDGVACCKACFDTVIRNGDDAGHGYRGVLYGGAEYQGGLSCFACKRSILP